MSNIPLTKAQVDGAQPLDFDTPRQERQANITIEVSPAGLIVKAEYTGSLASIPAAVEKLRAVGILDLVQASKAAVSAPAAPQRTKVERVEPIYQPDGTPCCPVHKRALTAGQYGLYCSAKAKTGDVANKSGFCGIKFAG